LSFFACCGESSSISAHRQLQGYQSELLSGREMAATSLGLLGLHEPLTKTCMCVDLKSWLALMLDSFRQQQASNIISTFWNFHRARKKGDGDLEVQPLSEAFIYR
jgi:hypothetical protein